MKQNQTRIVKGKGGKSTIWFRKFNNAVCDTLSTSVKSDCEKVERLTKYIEREEHLNGKMHNVCRILICEVFTLFVSRAVTRVGAV